MARNAPIVEPTTATQVFSDTCSRGGDVELAELPCMSVPGAPCATGGAGARAVVLDIRDCAAPPARDRSRPPPTIPAAADPSAACSQPGRALLGSAAPTLLKFPSPC